MTIGATMADEQRLADARHRAQQTSPFLARLIETLPAVAAAPELAGPFHLDDDDVARALRLLKQRTVLALALLDLAGLAPLETVTARLSDLADFALDTAIRTAIGERTRDAEPQGFAAIALGKHGSRELNFSSDIDPIFIYDPTTLPRRPREEPGEAAVRIARRVVELLQARTADGYVFRVDLRLRPASEATPLAIPIDAAIGHYESSALAWERAAFVRARAAAGDTALGDRFLAALTPFVWRRSLDFGAIGELRALTRAIRAHHGALGLGPGFDLKRGRGGIREVEFYAQIHQLIHGGRDPALRCGTTLTALRLLADAGRIAEADRAALADAYRALRTAEHRVQMIEDRQTHVLPSDPAALDAVAQLHGLADGAALLAWLAPGVDAVGALYDALDEARDPARRVGTAGTDPAFARFADPAAAAEQVARWRSGGTRAIRSPAAVAAFETLLPDLLGDLGRAPDPDAALARLDGLLGRLTSGVNLFRLLEAQPAVRVLLVDILSHAPTLADLLALRPALLDRLIDRSALDPLPAQARLIEELRGVSSSTEALLDRVRHVVGEYRFVLGVQLIAGVADPMDIATGYGRLADAAVDVVTTRIVADFEAAHGTIADGELIILAMGRYGGGRLTHASDLDLVYLFTGDYGAQSDGPRPLGATHYFNRLAQRVTAGLSVPTSVGSLYEVDTRLRPSGNQGPLVASLDAFARYQRESAWTWEHMALTRARPVFGSAAARAAVSAVIAEVLHRDRDRRQLARDVVAMRADIATHKPPKSALDVKLADGGLVDLEFTLHFHQLASGIGLTPDLVAALGVLTAAERIEPSLRAAHDLLTRLLVVLRLVAPDLADPPPATAMLAARACGVDSWPALLAAVTQARQCVSRQWRAIVAQAGEMQ